MINRQLKDIQSQAERLISSKPSMSDIESFGQYSEELKTYILNNVKDEIILNIANEIPMVKEETSGDGVTRTFISILLNYASAGMVYYFRDRQKVNAALHNVRTIQGKFSSIEFLMKNQ